MTPDASPTAKAMEQALADRIKVALECGVLWTEGAEAHSRMHSALADFNEWCAALSLPVPRLLTSDEAFDAYASPPWPTDSRPPVWMDRLIAVQRKLLEVNGFATPPSQPQSEQPGKVE